MSEGYSAVVWCVCKPPDEGCSEGWDPWGADPRQQRPFKWQLWMVRPIFGQPSGSKLDFDFDPGCGFLGTGPLKLWIWGTLRPQMDPEPSLKVQNVMRTPAGRQLVVRWR